MTAGLLIAAVVTTLLYGLVREAPPTPWAARRARREQAELEAWAAYRAAFYAAGPPARPARSRSRGTAPRRHGPRMWAVVDPVD